MLTQEIAQSLSKVQRVKAIRRYHDLVREQRAKEKRDVWNWTQQQRRKLARESMLLRRKMNGNTLLLTVYRRKTYPFYAESISVIS